MSAWTVLGILVVNGLVGVILFNGLDKKTGSIKSAKAVEAALKTDGGLRSVTELINGFSNILNTLDTLVEIILVEIIWGLIAALISTAIFYSLVHFVYLYGRIRNVLNEMIS